MSFTLFLSKCLLRQLLAVVTCKKYCCVSMIYLLLASFARSVRQVMDRVFSFLLWPKREARGPWKQGRKKRGSITCCTDRANEANKMFIIWLCWLFRFWKGDWELAVRTATYGPGIDQSQHAKSVSHIIKVIIKSLFVFLWIVNTYLYFLIPDQT